LLSRLTSSQPTSHIRRKLTSTPQLAGRYEHLIVKEAKMQF